MAEIINGTDLYMFINDELVAYSLSYTIAIEVDARETTNKGSGTMRSYKAGLVDVSGSCDALFVYGYSQLYDAVMARVPVKLEFGEKTTGDILNTSLEYYSGNFRLQAGSDCINGGINVGLATDYDGATVSDPPEIGAYEY